MWFKTCLNLYDRVNTLNEIFGATFSVQLAAASKWFRIISSTLTLYDHNQSLLKFLSFKFIGITLVNTII